MGPRFLVFASISLFAPLCTPVDQEPDQDESCPTTQGSEAPTPPMAERRAYEVDSPNGKRFDPYYWLRDDTRQDKTMLAYLEAENRYKDAILAPQRALEKTLYQEMVDRIEKNDESVPVREGDYDYFRRISEGQEFAVELRRKVGSDKEEVVIDPNERAKDKEYYRLAATRVSPDHRKAAFAEDEQGRRQYVIRFRDLESGAFLADEIRGASRSIAWANDNKSVFYIENDPTTLLSTRVKKHVLGRPVSEDVLVYEETDKSYYMGLGRSTDDQYVVIYLSSTTTSEQRMIPADQPDQAPQVIAPRRDDVKYASDHIDGRWIVRTNLEALNFRVMEIPDDKVGAWEGWRELVAHNKDVYIDGFQVFNGHLVTSELSEGLTQIHVRSWDGKDDYLVETDESAYLIELGSNPNADTQRLRYRYTSPTTPSTTYELDLSSQARTVLKTQKVGGGFDASVYETKRIWVKARDGVSVPVTLLHKKGLKLDGSAPLLQYGYGSYGSSVKPRFRSDVLSLVDRGYVYAIAHIRGGGTMGRGWYEDGKLLTKLNTFNDFIDVSESLIAQGYTKPERLAAMGGSAGGLLVGAVANMRPDLYNSILAQVPFVDVVTTMLDESIPLTTNEFDEWGNPKQKKYYDYMLSYSPYDNVEEKDYPAMLVTAGLWDSQVQYFEPTKWVARLRHRKTDKNPLVYHIDMEAGHGGKAGRFAALEERAMTYAFAISQAK